MAVFSHMIRLRVYRVTSWRQPKLQTSDFVDRLVLDKTEVDSVDPNGVTFPIIRLHDCRSAKEPNTEMSRRLDANFRFIAEWLDRQSSDTFNEVRANKLIVDIFIDVWMDQDQMELALPAALLRACGRLDLPIEIMSNDISAGQLIEWGAT
jgi:hypothetical protein